LSITVRDVKSLKLIAYVWPLEANPAHCAYDLRASADGKAVSNGQREKFAVELFERAISGHPAYFPLS
jgi:hypothetical protein